MRVTSQLRAARFSEAQLEALELWAFLAHVDLSDVETFDELAFMEAIHEPSGRSCRIDEHARLVSF